MKKKMIFFAVMLVALVLVTAVAYALTPVDTFNDSSQSSNVDTTACTTTTTPGTDMIGGERDVLVVRTAGADTVVANVNTTSPGQFAFSVGASTRGTALIQWDGADGACTLNATGLGGVNLNPDDGIALQVTSADLNSRITLRVYTDASNYSELTYTIPNAIATSTTFTFPFEQFTDVGTGADFGNVGAIEVFVDGTLVDSLDITLDFVNSDLTRDFGDLPSAYDSITTLANDGARHAIKSVYLGSGVDADANSQGNATANGDDTDGNNDDDGVTPVAGSNWGDGGGQLSVNAVFPSSDAVACLVGWIDWNGNGSFDVGGTTGGVSELVANQFVFASNTVNITTPTAAAYGGTYPSTLNARFRIFQRNEPLFTTLGLSLDGFGCPTGETEANISQLLKGLADNGEVEDYQWGFSPTAVSLQNSTASSATPFMPVMVAVVVALIGTGVVLVRRQRA
ncbi:MAG: hypothetical protein D6816_12500 [Bacteroidetes bacterium]|nr:MAG: hypothetical protein D6816_12500 [Bacteroidota bacterium]